MEIHWLAEMGVGGGIWLSLLIVSLFSALRDSRSNLSLALSASWLILLIAGQFETTFGIPSNLSGNAVFGCLLGMTMLLSQQEKTARVPEILQSDTPILTTAERISAIS